MIATKEKLAGAVQGRKSAPKTREEFRLAALWLARQAAVQRAGARRLKLPAKSPEMREIRIIALGHCSAMEMEQ